MLFIEHVNLVVDNLSSMLAFYQTAFPHWKVRAQGEGQWNGKPRKWLHFGDDYQYIALNDHGEGKNRDLEGGQIGLAHFAFVTDNISALTERLLEAGYRVSDEGGKSTSRQNVYFIDPAGFEIEFVQYFTDIPIERNQ